jgi:hypothetical protein
MVQAISDFFRKAEQQVTPDSCGASLYHGVMRHFLLELREVRPQMMFGMSVERREKYRQPRKRVPRWGAAPSNPNHLELILVISTAVQRQRSSAADEASREINCGLREAGASLAGFALLSVAIVTDVAGSPLRSITCRRSASLAA